MKKEPTSMKSYRALRDRFEQALHDHCARSSMNPDGSLTILFDPPYPSARYLAVFAGLEDALDYLESTPRERAAIMQRRDEARLEEINRSIAAQNAERAKLLSTLEPE